MSGKKYSFMMLLILLVLNQQAMVKADPVTVSLGIRNVPPSLSNLKIVIEKETIEISFLVEESNTLADLGEIVVMVYEIGDGMVISKFQWKGLGSEWAPKPVTSLSPSEDMSRSKRFLFSLTILRRECTRLIVSVTITDNAQNKVHDRIVLDL